MNNPKKVSVIMGVYNCEKTIAESLESIINQTYANWELVICDDASTDGTPAILEFYRSRHPDKIILLKNDTNRKLAYSLNRCLEASSGDYIARMDGDDISLLRRLEKQVAFLESHPEYELVGAGMIPFDENGQRDPRIAKAVPSRYDLKSGPCFFHATIVASKEVFDNLKGYTVLPRTQRGQDYDLWFRFFHSGYKGYNMAEPLYKVRESILDLRKRTFASRMYEVQTRLYGFRLLHFPLRYYVFAFKPVVAGLTPRRIMHLYHNQRFRKKKPA